MKSVKGLSGTSQVGGTKQRLPGDDLSNMGGSVVFMVNLFYFLHSDGNLMLRNFKQTREKIFHGVYPEHKKEMLRLRSA